TSLVRPLPTGQTGRDQDETLDEIRTVNSELERHATSLRVADHRGRAVDQFLDVPYVREGGRLQTVLAEAAEIWRDHPVSGCLEHLDLRPPHATVRDT